MAIPKLATDRKAREHLEELLDDVDSILRLDIARALLELGDARSRGPLRARAEIELDPRVRRRIKEAVRDLGADRKHQKPLEDALERLETEQKDLRARLAKLEAKAPKEKDASEVKAATPKPPKKKRGPESGSLARGGGSGAEPSNKK